MAQERQEISSRQRQEWLTFRRQYLEPCLSGGDEQAAKFIKTIADTLRIAQDGERRAMVFGEGIDDGGPVEVEWGE